MKRLVYVGSMSSAVLETGQEVRKGEAVEVPDEVATRYVGQIGNWRVENSPHAGKKKGGAD